MPDEELQEMAWREGDAEVVDEPTEDPAELLAEARRLVEGRAASAR